jgi:hypothetical protein
LKISASVTQIAWFDEEKEFAIAFTDGSIRLGRRNMNSYSTCLTAHRVSHLIIYVI